ncbi:hypothetical protein [Synechococcus sp. 1G10]|uniref:hypothetical protein n=1 Tax=Synechococcus sp. 1G10 TaxID=2025605 RepID=UPI001E57A43A|nr:hypothetical protein [Synechococcus sp. 1G10]
MSCYLNALIRKDPVAVIEQCHLHLLQILRSQRCNPIQRSWISDQPYGEEEITLLEEELIPAMEEFLARIKEIDDFLLAQLEFLGRCQLEAERDRAHAAVAAQAHAA